MGGSSMAKKIHVNMTTPMMSGSKEKEQAHSKKYQIKTIKANMLKTLNGAKGNFQIQMAHTLKGGISMAKWTHGR